MAPDTARRGMPRSLVYLGLVVLTLGMLAFTMASPSTSPLPPAAVAGEAWVPERSTLRSSPPLERRNTETDCMPSGPCELCLPVERHRDYCQSTGRRQEYVCRVDKSDFDSGNQDVEDSGRMVVYKSCARTAQDRMKAVLWFEICMAIIGTLAMYGVSQQKRSNQTLYDRRLHRRRTET